MEANRTERKKQRRRSKQEERQVVEESLEAGTSVVLVARAHGVNANQVSAWRKLYREGKLEVEGGGGLIAFRSHLSNLGLLLRGELGAASPGSTKRVLTTSRAIATRKPLLQQRAAQLVKHGRGSNHRQETVRKLAHQAGQAVGVASESRRPETA